MFFALPKIVSAMGEKLRFSELLLWLEFGESLGLQDSIMSESNHCDQKSSGGDDDDGQEKASCC